MEKAGIVGSDVSAVSGNATILDADDCVPESDAGKGNMPKSRLAKLRSEKSVYKRSLFFLHKSADSTNYLQVLLNPLLALDLRGAFQGHHGNRRIAASICEMRRVGQPVVHWLQWTSPNLHSEVRMLRNLHCSSWLQITVHQFRPMTSPVGFHPSQLHRARDDRSNHFAFFNSKFHGAEKIIGRMKSRV
jgi:hypothetical protein